MSAQPTFTSKQDEWAYYRRRDHSNFEALMNLVIGEIARRARTKFKTENPDAEKVPTFEMPPNVRHLVSALQGAHGGGQKPFEEFARDYLSIGAQLQFTGSVTAIRARVRHVVDELDNWQYLVGVQLIPIRKGGKIIGQHPDGTPIREVTTFIDHLKPHVDDGIQRARTSEQWRGDAVKGIKAHPGLALAEQVDSVIKNLPVLGSRTESGAEKPPTQKQPLTEYADKQQDRICDSAEKVADEIEARGGDSDLWLEKLENAIARRRSSRFKTKPARHDHASLTLVHGVGDTQNATTNTCNSKAVEPDVETLPEVENSAPAEAQTEADKSLCNSDVTQGFIGVCEDFAPPTEAEAEPNMLEWALFWASLGVPVFPCHEVYDEICTCTCADHRKKGKLLCVNGQHVCGSECKSKGKHPRTDFKLGVSGGVRCATLNPGTIKLWWGKYPTSNIGGRMGSESGFFGFDQDPRHGGNASLADLCDRHGHEWLKTWRNVSGSTGDHLLYKLPKGLKLPNSTGKNGEGIAPGIDTRGENGYLVMPPSLHASGNRYQVLEPNDFLEVPQFMIDALLTPKGERKEDIEFQENKGHVSVGNQQEKFLDGHRNDSLLANGLGRMRYAYARTEEEFYTQLSEVNRLKCVPPLDDEEVRELSTHIACDYAHLYGVNVKEKEAAA